MSKTIYRLSKTVKLKRMMVVSLCLSLVLLVALGGLTVYTVGVLKERRQMEEDLSRMEQESSVMEDRWEGKLSAVQGQLDDATTEQSRLNATIKSQEKEISKKDEEITHLSTGISKLEAGKSTQTTLDKNLPDREYPDNSGKKLVALTFDDGPGKYTEKLLDALKERNAKATFFVLGQLVDRYPELIKRMDEEGHTVGSHSYDHPTLTKLTYAEVRKNMEKTAQKIEKLIGHKPEAMRCPGGSCNDTVKKYAKNAGIPIIYWDVDTLDWKSRDTEEILEAAFDEEEGIEDGSIVLMHDIYDTTVEAAIQMVDRLIEEGYTLVTVPELLMAREGKIVAGKVY